MMMTRGSVELQAQITTLKTLLGPKEIFDPEQVLVAKHEYIRTWRCEVVRHESNTVSAVSDEGLLANL